ncbi:hypothetical protein CROQUDRAFT_93280 [Cronartium quercuum f. sp. fusiforme G11]|uniref:Uncharacterized protein n=1 Tax=Cronartium quercuum f. sp. fusiforme G11 TaxID=708437 RepID=A0A9P6NKZ5_9BASI|nr:hypothetical protein CROQUDRAFT_93280 [Cronartium quercuum f. sp. fusiforme G11]
MSITFLHQGWLQTNANSGDLGPDADWAICQTAFECITPDLLAKLYHACGYSLPPEMVQEY